MRIAYDAAPLLNPRTGVGHYAATLLDEMMSADPGIEFRLFALTRSAGTGSVPPSLRPGLRHRRIPARLAVAGWELAGWPPGEILAGDADVVHGTNFWVPPVRRARGVVTIHDLTFLKYPEMCTPQVQRYRWIVPKVLRRCAIVLTPSETVRLEVAAELGFPEDRIVATPEGVRGAFLGAAPDPGLAGRLGIGGDYILFAGTQEPRKNLERLIEALPLLADSGVMLVITGPPGWGSVDYPALAHKLGVEKRIVFSGYLPDRELASLMAGARVFAFPSLYEGFGLPALEAMAAGIPVVAGKAGALPEVLGGAPFWCDPFSLESIAGALGPALADEAARAGAIERGHSQAGRYSWAATARLTLDAYRLARS